MSVSNQGVRYLLAPLLIEYPKALLAFRAQGNSAESRDRLRAARRANRYVPRHILAGDEADDLPDLYEPGSPEEGAICAFECRRAWENTPGALKWLERQAKR